MEVLLSLFPEDADGLVDIHFHPVLEGDDESFGEFIEYGATEPCDLIIISGCPQGILDAPPFSERLNVFHPLELGASRT